MDAVAPATPGPGDHETRAGGEREPRRNQPPAKFTPSHRRAISLSSGPPQTTKRTTVTAAVTATESGDSPRGLQQLTCLLPACSARRRGHRCLRAEAATSSGEDHCCEGEQPYSDRDVGHVEVGRVRREVNPVCDRPAREPIAQIADGAAQNHGEAGTFAAVRSGQQKPTEHEDTRYFEARDQCRGRRAETPTRAAVVDQSQAHVSARKFAAGEP